MSPHRSSARQAGDSTLLSDRSGVPIVVRVDQDAADRLGVPLDTLVASVNRARFAHRLKVWGKHADGRPVFRLRELEALLNEAEVAGG